MEAADVASAADIPVPSSSSDEGGEIVSTSQPNNAAGAEDDGDDAQSNDDEEEMTFDESQLEAIPRSDAGALATVSSLGVSGASIAEDNWDNAGTSSDVSLDSDSLFGEDLESYAPSFNSLDDSDAYDSEEETLRGNVNCASAIPASAKSWAICELACDAQSQPHRRGLLQKAMREAGAHIEAVGACSVMVYAPSETAKERALVVLQNDGAVYSNLQDTPELHDDDDYEAEDGAAEVSNLGSYSIFLSENMMHAVVYPLSLEHSLQAFEIWNFDHEFPFKLDQFQNHACTCIARFESVLVAANTSAGKTAVAEFAIAQSLRGGRRLLYTSPLKALSNQKFVELQRRFPNSVGLMTGDVTLHSDANVIILTTEVLSAMVYNQLPTQPDLFDSFDWVVFDEAQYIGDEQRGTNWEECFIFLPEHLRCVLLAATIPNTEAIASWIARTRFEIVHVVSSVFRPVPLKHEIFLCGDPDPYDKRQFVPVYRRWNFHPAFVKVVNEKADTLGARHWICNASLMGRFIGKGGANLRKLEKDAGGASIDVDRQTPHIIRVWASSDKIRMKGLRVVKDWLSHHGQNVTMPSGTLDIDARDLERLLCLLKARGKLPLIGFSFEKKQCEQIALTLAAAHRMDFTSPQQKLEIDAAIAHGVACLSEDDRKLKQVKVSSMLLRRGIGVHHSGMLPFVRELTELLFSRGLLAVVFATDTFAIGLNMPAKTVVFCALAKFDGTVRRPLNAGEFKQMAGRAGRRGLDNEGTAVVLARQPHEAGKRTVDLLWELYTESPPEICSRFKLRWSSLVHMLRSGPAHMGYAVHRTFREGSSLSTASLLEDGASMQTVLHQRDYVDKSGVLLPKGEMLARLSVPSDPVFVTEVLVKTQCLSGLQVTQMFAVCVCFVGDGPAPKERVRVADRAVAAMLEQAKTIAAGLYEDLVQAKFERAGDIVAFINTRVHAQLANTALLWAEGVDFTEAVRRSGIPVGGEGLLVRTFRRLDELMREVAYICRYLIGLPEIATAIQKKREETRRGVLVIPSLYLGDAEDPLADPIPQHIFSSHCPAHAGDVIWLSPLCVGFSHNSCSARFRDTQVSLLTTARSLIFGWLKWHDLPPIRVFWHRGRFYTLANRRLAAGRLWSFALEGGTDETAVLKMPVHVVSEDVANRWGWQQKFTTGFTQGRSIRIQGTCMRVGYTKESTTFGVELWEETAFHQR